MKVIAIANQKGGVAKTTTSLNFGNALAKRGNKVLLIDLDSQSSLSLALGVREHEERKLSISDLFNYEIEDKEFDAAKAIVNIKENLDLLPSDIRLAGVENKAIAVMRREFLLRGIINNINSKVSYDYIIIDCSPSLAIYTLNALGAADEIIVPISPAYLSVSGMKELMGTISKAQKYLNPNLKLRGCLFTMVDRRSYFVKRLISNLRENYDTFEAEIPCSIRAVESAEKGVPIIDYDKNSKVAVAYETFTAEYLSEK